MKRETIINPKVDKLIYEAIERSNQAEKLFYKALQKKELVDIANKTGAELTPLLKKILGIPLKMTIHQYRKSLKTKRTSDEFSKKITAFWCGLAEYLGTMLCELNPKYKERVLWIFYNTLYKCWWIKKG